LKEKRAVFGQPFLLVDGFKLLKAMEEMLFGDGKRRNSII
jgi:hypothetical protein